MFPARRRPAPGSKLSRILIAESVPTVGGKAHAYAPPCSYEWWVYEYVWAEYQEYGGQHYYDFVVVPAKDAYYDCLYG